MKKLVILFPLLICLVQVFCQIPLKEKSNMDLSKVVFSPSSRFCFLAFGHEAIVCNSSGETIAEFKTPDAILAIAFSPDERFISTAESSGRLAIWDTKGKLIKSQNGSRLWLSYSAIAYSPDGTKLVHGKDDNTAFLLNSNGDFIAALDHSRRDPNSVSIAGGYDGRSPLQGSHNKEITFVKFTPDGNKIFTSSQDSSAFLWDKNGKLLSKIKNPYGVIQTLDFAKDGKFISGHKDGRVVLWDNKGIFIRVIEKLEQPIIYTQFLSDGNYSYATDDATLIVRKISGEIIRKYNLDPNSFLRLHALSPDGKFAVYVVNGRGLFIKNLAQSQPFNKDVKVNYGKITSVDFSPKSKFFLTGSDDGSAILWDITGAPLHIFDNIRKSVTCVKFSSDGESIFTGTYGENLKQWNLKGDLIQEYIGHKEPILAVAVSSDGKHVLTGSKDNTAILWDLNGKIIQTFIGHTSPVNAVAFSPNGKLCVTASANGSCTIWGINGVEIRKINPHKASINCIVFAPNGAGFFTGSDDKSIIFQDINGKIINKYTGATNKISSLAVSPDGKKIVAGSWGELNEWNISDNDPKKLVKNSIGTYSACAFSPDGALLVTGNLDQEIGLWNEKREPIKSIKGHSIRIQSLSISNEENQFMSLGLDNNIIFWDFNGKIVKSLNLDKFITLLITMFDRAVLSPDGKTLITMIPEGIAYVFNDSLISIDNFVDFAANSLSFSPNSKYLVTGGKDAFVTIRGVSNLKQPLMFKGHRKEVTCSIFSPNSQFILSGSQDSSAILWDLKGTPLMKFIDKAGSIESVAFAPNGQTILIGNSLGQVSVWDITGKKISTFTTSYIPLNYVNFSPSGKSIFTINSLGELKRWDLTGKAMNVDCNLSAKTLVFSKDGKYGVISGLNTPVISIIELSNE